MTVATTAPTDPTAVDRSVDETPATAAAPTPLVERDLLVEDVSIDGMCGVY